jgi:hypothetical protein
MSHLELFVSISLFMSFVAATTHKKKVRLFWFLAWLFLYWSIYFLISWAALYTA